MTQPFKSPSSRVQLGWLALLCVWSGLLALAVGGFLIGDEWVHWQQIKRFVHGDFRVYAENLTNIPGYHWMVTALLWPFGTDSLGLTRMITAVMFALSVLLFWRIRADLHPEDAQRASAQFFFLPVMFVYGFMAYTDIPALMFLLGALLACIRQRHGIAAILLLASMAVRQNNVLWVVFIAVFSAWPLLVVGYTHLRRPADESWEWRRWFMRMAAQVWPYVLCVACFCLYWLINGSISYSSVQSQNAHPDLRLDIGNPMFLLAVTGLLFPVQMAAGWRRLVACGSTRGGWWVWLLPLFVAVAYAWLFKVHHPYNAITGGNVRNQALQLVAAGGPAAVMFGALAMFSAGGLAFSRYVVPHGWLWLPFSMLFVGASWMIETRYTIIPLCLFLLLRKPASKAVERVTLIWWALLSLWLAWQVFNHRFML